MYQGISNGNAPKFQRTGSQICASPEDELIAAVLENNSAKIEQLIRRNETLLSYTYPDYNKRILLIACSEETVNASTVETLLKLNANPRDRTEDNGWEAIHWACQKTDYGTVNALLRRNPGDINVVDSYGNNSLQILIRHGNKDSPDFIKCASLLINTGIDVNHVDNKNKTALYWAEKKKIGDRIRSIIDAKSEPINNNSRQNIKNDISVLLDYLRQGREEDFINCFQDDCLVDSGDDSSTLLQICCKRGMAKAVQHLLNNGADPNKTGNKDLTKPVIVAAEHGYSEILKLLLDKYDNILVIPEGLLGLILQDIDREHHDNRGCYKVFMDKLRGSNPDEVSIKLNEPDCKNNTPLHYAIRYGDKEITEELLSLGASLGAKNKYGIMPVQDIEPETLKQHLDNCVQFDLKSKKIEKEGFQVKFNYRSIIPPYAKSSFNEQVTYKDPEAAGITASVQKSLVAETEVIFFMSQTSEFKHLLKHPVIVSFLFMKWLRVQWLFWANLIFYITFALSLVVYIFCDYAYFSPEGKSVFQVLFATLSYAVLVITLIILMFRELFQICVAPTKYLTNFENYIEIALIILTSFIVFKSGSSEGTRKQLSSLAILFAAFELVLMLGQHPYFSTNVVMLKTVSFNFFKFLIWYSLLIIAFALSFYLLFTPTDKVNVRISRAENNDSAVATNDDEDESFVNPGKSLFKTIIMLTGEFDASSINFDNDPYVSKFIFALFIFMIAIILLNLLNGLAVSDTQMIKNDAELVGHIARAEHIRYVESMLIGNIIPVNVMKKLNDVCCCIPNFKSCNIGMCNRLSRNTCLFPKYLNYELIFYPNKYGQVEYFTEDKRLRKSCVPCATICLDRETVRRTNSIVLARRDDVEKNEDFRLQRLEDALATLQVQLDKVLDRLGAGKC
ncbi:transient receptor potential cation channel protein painless-like [Anthonomus grandis grandis]|uniref:transient receptor potential cation channel protein painless-like n=1 Tax=Anthonomus grandis grandis TaxID=2921223 RepID=UPI0021651D29|nr:transient receptor potential cation channel protein painless-like [Anthonomus grandis grandis]